MIESQHLYSWCAIVLSKQEKRRMDGLKDRCLRSILNIRIIRMYSQCIHSFFPSGVSKGEMLQESHHKPASTLLLVERKPLARLGKAMSAWPSFATASFSPGSLLQEQKFYLWHFQVLAACKTDWKLYAIEDNGTSGFYSSLVSWLGRVLLCLSAVWSMAVFCGADL